MVRDNMNLCQVLVQLASQIPILVTAPPAKKTNLHERFHTVIKLNDLSPLCFQQSRSRHSLP